MKIALIQDDIYLPSFGGGLKANRRLLEDLVQRGHECLVLPRALTRSSDGPRTVQEFAAEMGSRGIIFQQPEANVFSYEYAGVQVEALNFADTDAQRDYLERRLREINPDWIFVTDDKRRIMLPAAMAASPSRVILMLQTIIQLPFGPISVDKNPAYADLIRSARAVIVISHFMKDYIHEHGDLDAHLLRLPVYGKGPFPDLSSFDRGFVTMINPCELKGVSIFIGLARAFPNVEFAAVPTWGADRDLLDRLRAMPNVHILQADNDIEVILAQTRILLVPSLWHETFGYVAPEAMLRGIPVLASDIGGLPEAKLGVDYVLPVVPGEFGANGFISHPQDIAPWTQALDKLLSNEDVYLQCSRQSRQAAHDFVATVSVSPFEALMEQLADTR
ncbi:MAG: glycosyltransferase family 4 protein [Gammaproteobacteria bacterium]|jgi:glycosyltransferase involved in cell wall biosynthesis|nr:glycosyltransferase family 4 protein [Gammaproteobacteria bacterium]